MSAMPRTQGQVRCRSNWPTLQQLYQQAVRQRLCVTNSKAIHVLPAPNNVQTTLSPATSHSSQLDSLNHSKQSNQPRQSSISDPSDRQNRRLTEPDLLYLNILNDAAQETTEPSQHHTPSNTPCRSRQEDGLTPRNLQWTRIPHLDDIDNEYLAKKGVFNLPPPQHLDALVKTYFDHVDPFAPVINRADFIRGYQSGDCSLFLLCVILTPATLHAPADVLSACGFASRSAAQESFFSKAKLLHDFAVEGDPLLMLQGSIILCMVILDHSTDRHFGYWFHNAIHLATKLNLRDTHSRLLENTPAIKPRTEDDWEAEDITGASSGLLSAITPQQKASPVAHCELSRIFGQCLSVVTSKPKQDPRLLMQPLDAWRRSLATKMHVGGDTRTDVYYLNIQAMSYRFECILCRLIQRCLQQSQHADWIEWAKERLRCAILELDLISLRVLASGTLQDFPMSFVTTITALLALHIESALDPAETDLVRSMARISISQTMLVLTQGNEIPVLKRALPVFEEILTKNNLYLVPPNILGQVPAQWQSQFNNMADAYTSLNTQGNMVPPQFEQGESNVPLYGDFLGLDFLDDGKLASWSSLFDVDMGSQELAE
ncbi:hypothetical protein ED733_006184 [Metarhizium rileyi]|uniref:Xylanolytic transcriptional activator regulatory domain-containing protein n=1 Tax=Metarhizium rileyi (strain RCEF 4871) TaxID=1649241 RepID=A0A5C6GMH7_METRR|nr:hypothetical protein ED733_006184 [Metarhizium rileyi]